MSQKILLQTLLKFRDRIKDGSAKVQDIVTDYFNQTGKSVTEEDRAIILNEFAKEAPDNVTTLEGVDAVETILPLRGPNVQKAGEMSDTAFTDKVKKDKGIESLRGDETLYELLEKLGPSKEEGLGSLFPKGKPGSILDQKNINREEVAEFIRKMRGAGIKNEDIKKVIKEETTFKRQPAFRDRPDMPKEVVDLEGGKRAATTLARAADMGADTKVKQELLSELDEMKMDKGPRFFQEEYMGFDDFRSAEDAKKIEVNNAIVDDLEKMGVEDETVMFIMGRAREINKKPFYTSGEDFVDIIKDELEFQGIDYDVEFYKNYFKELTRLMRKPEPRFLFGGAV